MNMSSLRPPIAVFDLDGTLADSALDLVGTLNVLLAREHLPPLPLEAARPMIGAGAMALIERGWFAAGHTLSQQRLEALFQDFLDHYRANICVHTRLFPGVEAALDRLQEAGFVLAVCTNKMAENATDLLKQLGVANRFAAICGRDSFAYFKPDPRHLTETIARANGDAARAIMIGDSETDIFTAKAADIPVVAVTFGYTEIPVQDLAPNALIDHYDQLWEAMEGMMMNVNY
jgi:phosphoglycolate phosphatase